MTSGPRRRPRGAVTAAAAPTGLVGRYAALLRGTGAAAPLAASLLGRLALGTTGFALLLFVRESAGSYAAAGAVSAAYAVSFAACAPSRARRADRSGPRGVLLTCAVLHPAVLAGLVLLGEAGAGPAVLVVAGVLAGATVPPLSGVVRALWGQLVPPDQLPTAYSLESVVIELCFIGGPLLVAGLVALQGPAAAVLCAGLLVLVGASWLASTPAVRAVVPHAHPAGRVAGPLTSPAVRALLLIVVCVGAGFGVVEVALPAFLETRGAGPSAAGVLLAVFGAGSVVGGLAYGAVRPRAPYVRQLFWLVAALAVGTALPLLATGPVAMGVTLILYGLTVAPISACTSVLLGAAAPVGTVTEAFTWSSSMIFGGVALGSAAAGWLVEAQGVEAALLLLAATGSGALVASVVGSRALRP